MYYLINNHIDRIVDHINPENDIQTYQWMIESVQEAEISRNVEFRNKYRQYWRMNPARFSHDFLTYYFQILDQHREAGQLNIGDVLQELHNVPTHNNGRQTLQLSFASKLMHVISPECPVYDKMVAHFFFLSLPGPGPIGARIQACVDIYDFIIEEYARIQDQQLLDPAINMFREHFELGDLHTNVRIIDILIWTFVKLALGGAVREHVIIY